MSEMFFDESVILLDVEGETPEEVLKTVASNMANKGLVKQSYINAIIEREKEYPTGLPTPGVSVAIPHTDIEHVNKKSISFAVLKNPVEFYIMGDTNKHPFKFYLCWQWMSRIPNYQCCKN